MQLPSALPFDRSRRPVVNEVHHLMRRRGTTPVNCNNMPLLRAAPPRPPTVVRQSAHARSTSHATVAHSLVQTSSASDIQQRCVRRCVLYQRVLALRAGMLTCVHSRQPCAIANSNERAALSMRWCWGHKAHRAPLVRIVYICQGAKFGRNVWYVNNGASHCHFAERCWSSNGSIIDRQRSLAGACHCHLPYAATIATEKTKVSTSPRRIAIGVDVHRLLHASCAGFLDRCLPELHALERRLTMTYDTNVY